MDIQRKKLRIKRLRMKAKKSIREGRALTK
jgi:hypothetical protein